MEKKRVNIPELEEYLALIEPVDSKAMADARTRQDYLVKVPGSLGGLEEISIRLAGITGKVVGNQVDKPAIILMCADNGVVEEGVASAPQTVTQMQTINFTRRITGVGAQADYFGIDILDIDIGVKLPIPPEYSTESMYDDSSSTESTEAKRLATKVVNRRIAEGTKNFTKEPAMSREETIRAIKIGIEAVEACVRCGKNVIGVGEMGIGNTTTASAIIAAIVESDQHLYEKIETIVGRGGGLSDQGLRLKKKTIITGLEQYRELYIVEENGESILDPITLLSSVGGFDIAGMTGAYLAAAANKIPVVVDGVISIAAALLAVAIKHETREYMFTSHRSKEGGYALAAEALGIEPMYDLYMRLGEGSGCPIAFKIMEAACAVMNGMWSLEDAQVDSEYLEEFREDGQFK